MSLGVSRKPLRYDRYATPATGVETCWMRPINGDIGINNFPRAAKGDSRPSESVERGKEAKGMGWLCCRGNDGIGDVSAHDSFENMYGCTDRRMMDIKII